MATLATVRARTLNLLANNSMISSADATALVQAEHQTLLNDYGWSRRKQETMINTVGAYNTGTVTATGTAVVGTGTAFTVAMIGRWIRIGSGASQSGTPGFWEIVAVADATHLTIESPGIPDPVTAQAYVIFKHVYLLPVDWGRVVNITSDVRLTEWQKADIDRLDPSRTSTGTPDIYTVRGLYSPGTANSVFQIEFWPVPSSVQNLRVEYLIANDLVNDTDEPLYRSDVLVWKSAESGAFFLHGKTGDLAWLALADRYHQRFTESLEGAREDDLAKSSPASHVRDSAGGYGRGANWDLSHDGSFLS